MRNVMTALALLIATYPLQGAGQANTTGKSGSAQPNKPVGPVNPCGASMCPPSTVSALAPRVKAGMDQVAGLQAKNKSCMGTDTAKEAERLASYGKSVHGTMSKDNNADPAIIDATTKYVQRYEDEVRKFMADAKSKCP